MKNILLIVHKEKGDIVIIFFLLLLSILFDLFGLSLIIPLIQIFSNFELFLLNLENMIGSNILAKYIENLPKSQLLIIVFSSFIFFNFLKGFFFVYSTYKANIFTKKNNTYLSNTLLKKYLEDSYNKSENTNIVSSVFIRNILEECEKASYSVLNLISILSELVVLTVLSIFLFLIEPWGTLILVAVLLFGLTFYKVLSSPFLKRWANERQKLYSLRLSQIIEAFNSFVQIKLLKKENEVAEEFLVTNDQLITKNLYLNVANIIPRFLVEILSLLSISLVAIYMLIQNYEIEKIAISLGIIAAAGLKILPGFIKIYSLYNNIKFYRPSVNLIKNEIYEPNNKKKLINKNKKFKFIKRIRLKNISFSYGEKKILDKINLEIKKGDIVGIKGRSGEGKSTLIKILLGLLKPETGEILIDNFNLNKRSNRYAWHEKISYVPQNIYLLNASLVNNIIFSQKIKNFNNTNYNYAIENACIDNFKKLDDKMGEDGALISGGQKQRIGIARALYLRRDITIFDEATSSLDTFTERKILNNLIRNKKKETTYIIISHKNKFLKKCNKIYLLNNKKIKKL